MGTVAQDRKEKETKNQEKDVWLPASQSPRPSHCRPCLTHHQACGEGALTHLHAARLQRAHWPGNQPRLWPGTRLWTWTRSCLWPGLMSKTLLRKSLTKKMETKKKQMMI